MKKAIAMFKSSKIEHFVDQELEATLGNKRVDRKHRQIDEQGGGGESRGAILGSAAILD